jgi:preprotein translocase subunit YajC
MKTFFFSLFSFGMLLNSGLYAETVDTTTTPRDQGFTQTLVMIAIALLFFYFILWRPEQKRRKAMEATRSSLKRGDRVTAMGIVGTVLKVQEHTIIVRMVDGSKIEFIKAAISDVQPGSDEDAKKADKDDRSMPSKKTDISEIQPEDKE